MTNKKNEKDSTVVPWLLVPKRELIYEGHAVPFKVEGKRDQEDGGYGLPVKDKHKVVHPQIEGYLGEQEHPGIYSLDQYDGEIRFLSSESCW